MNTANKLVNILLVNFHSRCNAGDAALLDVSINQIKRVFPAAHIVVAANWPFEPNEDSGSVEVIRSPYALCGVGVQKPITKQIGSALYGAILGWLSAHHLIGASSKAIPCGWDQLFCAYRNADFVAAVPGNQFLSTGRWGWPFPLIALAIQLTHWFNKPLYILPQSIGPLKRNWEKFILHSIYRKARLIFLRDAQSMRLAKQLHFPEEKTRYVPDPAFDLPAGNRNQVINLLKEYGYVEGEPCLGVTVIGRMGHSLNQEEVTDYYNYVSLALSEFLSRHQVHIFFFNQVIGPTPIEDDRRATRTILDALSKSNKNHWNISVVDKPLPPEMLKACYGIMDLFIASRLHSGIFAMAMGVPTVFVGYLTKTRGLLEALGLDTWLVELGEQDQSLLQSKIDMAWQNRQDMALKLREIIPDVVENARKIPVMIHDDYAAYEQQTN